MELSLEGEGFLVLLELSEVSRPPTSFVFVQVTRTG